MRPFSSCGRGAVSRRSARTQTERTGGVGAHSARAMRTDYPQRAGSAHIGLAARIISSAAAMLANSMSPTALARISITSTSWLLTLVHPSRRALVKSSRETSATLALDGARSNSTNHPCNGERRESRMPRSCRSPPDPFRNLWRAPPDPPCCR